MKCYLRTWKHLEAVGLLTDIHDVRDVIWISSIFERLEVLMVRGLKRFLRIFGRIGMYRNQRR